MAKLTGLWYGFTRKRENIASGHAWRKHVIERNEFPGIATQDEFADFIDGIMTSQALPTKELSRSQEGWWDSQTGCLVIADPNHPDAACQRLFTRSTVSVLFQQPPLIVRS